MNEDRVLDQPEAGLWAVADGMGGHRDGDIAASRLVEALASLRSDASGYGRLTEAARRVARLNAELFELRHSAGPIGSTLVLLLVHEAHYACVWAGDSRAYRLRDGRITAITRDHSLVQELVETGVISDSERRNHPGAHITTRAVGARPELELDHRFASIEAGDIFLLCSDGLTGCLKDQDIAAAIRPHDLAGSAERLLSAALEDGAPDNISFVLIRADEHQTGPVMAAGGFAGAADDMPAAVSWSGSAQPASCDGRAPARWPELVRDASGMGLFAQSCSSRTPSNIVCETSPSPFATARPWILMLRVGRCLVRIMSRAAVRSSCFCQPPSIKPSSDWQTQR